MDGNSVAKVGLVVLLALVLAVGGYSYLSHQSLDTYLVKAHFKDTRGLLRQSLVRLKGVGIGEVRSVKLEDVNGVLTPTVEMAIENRYSIPANYQFVIISGLLITNPTIEVRPPLTEGRLADAMPLPKDNKAVVEGADAASPLDTIDPKLTQTVTKLNTGMDTINAKLDKTFTQVDILLGETNRLVRNSNDTIVGAKNIIADPRLRTDLLVTADNFKQLSIDTRRTTATLSKSLTGVLDSSRPKLEKLGDESLILISKLGDSIDSANLVVKKLTEQVSDPRLQSSLQETIELARSTLSSTRQIASDIHQLTGDPALQANVKESAANLKLITERSAATVDRLNSLLDRVSGAADKLRLPKAPKVDLLVGAQESVDPGRFRLDVDARVPIGKRNLLDVGLYDLGEDTRLNLQGGTRLSDLVLARYGLHASRLGVGLDVGKSAYSGFRLDLYDANHPRLDVKGLIRVNKNASIWAGADGILHGAPVPTVGIQLNN